jgi:predicted RecA/RadA family phage recombinase
MAKNRRFAQEFITWPSVKATAQTASRTTNFALSGDPVVVGQQPGVALLDADSLGKTTIQIDGIYRLAVTAKDSSGVSGADANVAVFGGDKIYFNKDVTPPLSKRASGIPWGVAVGDAGVQLVASGANGSIDIQVGV